MKYTSYSETHVGLVRKANEDSHAEGACLNDAYAFVVCDGMGGHVGGATASSMAVKGILDFLAGADLTDCNTAISNACKYANTLVFQKAASEPSLQGMGTTCVVLLMKDDHCYFGHVGDSRLYVFTNKELHRLTRDQSFVQMLVDKGEISDDEAESHPKKNQILQAIGIGPEIKPGIGEMRISPKKGDRLMLCTDGLNGMINDKLIASAFRNNDNLKACAGNLIQLALDNGGRDNVTVSLIEITESSHTSSVFKSENPAPSAPGTGLFPPPQKITGWPAFVKKYKIHAIAGGSALLALVLVMILLKNDTSTEPTGQTNQGNSTVNTRPTVDLKELKKKSKDELDKLRNTQVSGLMNDTIVKSENDSLLKLRVIRGVFVNFEVTKVVENKVVENIEIPKETNGKEQDNKKDNASNPKKEKDNTSKKQSDKSYTVKEGDILSKIAAKFNNKGCKVTEDSITDDNGLNNKNDLKAGRKLIIKCH